MDESLDTASNEQTDPPRDVIEANYVNRSPKFDDEDADTDGNQATREVAENSAEGTEVGDPVAATDPDETATRRC